MDNALELKQISKKYPHAKVPAKGASADVGDFWALEDVSFQIGRGEIIGIIGRNGAGKTTLLNILAGILSPTKGEQAIRGKILGLFNLGAGFQDELSGRENIFLNGVLLGASKLQLEQKLDSIIAFSELGDFINMPLGTYSQGMRLRLGFSIVTSLDFDILVIDEVLAVGDALFQLKCFQRLVEFRSAGKTLIITTQNMDLIERLCDRVLLLDHGRQLFYGNTIEAINRYRSLLNTERFFVGKMKQDPSLVKNTKKWVEDMPRWGKKLGTKEMSIDSVDFINKSGARCEEVESRQPLRIRANFTARSPIKEPHFGVAIFRNDGVYCYGPNTAFDNYEIKAVKPGKGWFELDCKELALAAGEYRVSVAIWDKNELLPFDYHSGYYSLPVYGNGQGSKELLNIPVTIKNGASGIYYSNLYVSVPLPGISDQDTGHSQINILSVSLSDEQGKGRNIFRTNESACLKIDLNVAIEPNKNLYIWTGIFRDDDVYCQGFTMPLNGSHSLELFFPELALLPGGYRIALGIWDNQTQGLLFFRSQAGSFHMVFDKQDHGTVYLKHDWKWGLA